MAQVGRLFQVTPNSCHVFVMFSSFSLLLFNEKSRLDVNVVRCTPSRLLSDAVRMWSWPTSKDRRNRVIFLKR